MTQETRLVANTSALLGAPLDALDGEAFSPQGAAEVRRLLGLCPRHVETPLRQLDGLASAWGVAEIAVKDEGPRLGLGSFKALGGAYAVFRLLLRQAEGQFGRAVMAEELRSPAVRHIAASMTVCCATDGNHGRSVAAAAQVLGCRAVIFVHAGVAPARVAAISDLGADIRTVEGAYDDAVRAALDASGGEGWTLVSDTSWPGYEQTPRLVMQGYAALMDEVAQGWRAPPTHVFLQAGVGGLAASAAAYLRALDLPAPPTVVVVEPSRAACLLASFEALTPVAIPAIAPTNMALLECYEPSHLAWSVLMRTAHAFMTISDAEATAAVALLARLQPDDAAILSAESGAAGLAALRSILDDPGRMQVLGLEHSSRVLLINTEGAIDPDAFRAATGLDVAEIETD